MADEGEQSAAVDLAAVALARRASREEVRRAEEILFFAAIEFNTEYLILKSQESRANCLCKCVTASRESVSESCQRCVRHSNSIHA